MRSSFAWLRIALLGALGASAAACGSDVGNAATEGSGGTGSGDPGSTGNGAGSTGTGASGVCAGAVPVPASDGADSGYMKCPDGTIHRAVAEACGTAAPACKGTEEQINCSADADCKEAPNGR